MEIAGLLIQPAVLLVAFIFFWREAKAGRQELRAELKAGMHQMETRIREDIGKVESRIAQVESRIDRVEVRIDRVENRIARIEDLMLGKNQTATA